MPDLTWEVKELIALEYGRFVVRGVAAGTPIGPFLGVEKPTGRSFSVMSIDILTLAEGKIVRNHLQDWTSPIAHLTSAA